LLKKGEKMTRKYARKTNQSPQKHTDSWILQRTAVRSIPAKPLRVQTKSQALGSECFKRDLTQIPVSHKDTPEVQPKLMVGSRGRSGDSGKQNLEELHGIPVQAKLAIGEPDDRYEREADRAAKQVVQQVNGPQSRQLQQQQTILKRKPMLQHQGDGVPMAAAPELESAIARSRGTGQPLSDRIREPMEKAFGGVDFSRVKVHTDGTSDRLNQSMQAKAFTTGQDVFFRQGAYNPGSQGGQELLAHELTHVVQQNAGTVKRQIVQRNGDDDRKKKENRLEASKFRSQYTRDAIRDAAEAREQGMTVEEFRSQKQEERLKGFRASLTGRYPEEFDRLRENLNAARAGLERDRAQMLEILEEENLLLQIAIAPNPGVYITELGQKASEYRQLEQQSKKKGLKKIFESKESKAKRQAEKASAAQIAEEYSEQALLGKSNAKRIARIRALVNMVRPNENMHAISDNDIASLAEYVNEQIETAGSSFDVSHLHEIAGNLKDEPTARAMEKIILKGGIQSLHKRREENDKLIDFFEKDLKEFSLGKIGQWLEKLGPKENKEEREQRQKQGQAMLQDALKQREEINKMIELSQEPRYQERADKYEKNFQNLERLTKQKEARNK